MIFYIASPTYQQVIHRSIQELEFILEGYENSKDIYLLKYIKENLHRLDGLDCFLVDVSAVQDTDKEILKALETMRIMAAKTRIILLATNYNPGDELLIQCLHMSIYDIILTDDFNEIHEELKFCIREGKQYKDAIRFQEKISNTEKIVKREEIRQAANKIMLGFAGAQNRIGTTHNAILLASYLRKQGYMVALAEYNNSGCFAHILNEFEERIFEDAYFSMNGVDYYPKADAESLNGILGKSYNFIIIDFGSIFECDRITFHKCHEYFVLMGSKPWEVDKASEVFRLAGETVSSYHYYFNFTRKEVRKEVKEGMEGLPSVHFLEYTENPFSVISFPDAEELLANYLPIKKEKEKKKIFNIKGNVFRKLEKKK